MNITILNVVKTTTNNKNGGAYQIAEVAYKNNTFGGKVEGKKVTSYSKAAFDTLVTAQPGDVFDVKSEKNAGGFNEWVSLSKAQATTQSVSPVVSPGQVSQPAGSFTPRPNGTFETPEERAKKQVYIVRQSSITNAIACLSIGAKVPLKGEDVKVLARVFEQFVFNGGSGFDDVPTLDPSFVAGDPQIE